MYFEIKIDPLCIVEYVHDRYKKMLINLYIFLISSNILLRYLWIKEEIYCVEIIIIIRNFLKSYILMELQIVGILNKRKILAMFGSRKF